MMPFCAAVDWGTSRFRLWLIAADGSIIAHAQTDQGMTNAAQTGFDLIIEQHLGQLGCDDDVPVVVCGMAGARQGWIEAKYVDAPADLNCVLSNAVSVPDSKRDIRILPGIAQRDPKHPDVMRGEETQLLGLLEEIGHSKQGQTICMPGTHSKWVILDGSKLKHFTTYMTGELFAAIAKNTVLSASLEMENTVDPQDDIFLGSVARSIEAPRDFNASLFTLRSSQLLGYASPFGGKAALSGAVIGMELAGALAARGKPDEVILLGSGRLGDLYESALNHNGVRTLRHDAENAGLKGLLLAARNFWSDDAQSATTKLGKA